MTEAIPPHNWHPENLKPNKHYKFEYRTASGKIVKWEGTFVKMEGDKENKCLWLWFQVLDEVKENYYRTPLDWSSVVHVEGA